METGSYYLRQRHRGRDLPEYQRQASFVARDTAIMRRLPTLGPRVVGLLVLPGAARRRRGRHGGDADHGPRTPHGVAHEVGGC